MYAIGLFQIRLSIFFYFLLSSGTNRQRTEKISGQKNFPAESSLPHIESDALFYSQAVLPKIPSWKKTGLYPNSAGTRQEASSRSK